MTVHNINGDFGARAINKEGVVRARSTRALRRRLQWTIQCCCFGVDDMSRPRGRMIKYFASCRRDREKARFSVSARAKTRRSRYIFD